MIQQRTDYVKILIAIGIGTFSVPFFSIPILWKIFWGSLGLIWMLSFIRNIAIVDNDVDKKLGGLL
jgi:hypothetical protein